MKQNNITIINRISNGFLDYIYIQVLKVKLKYLNQNNRTYVFSNCNDTFQNQN